MAAISLLNPKAEFARAAQALAVNISAAKGIQDVMKTNLGPKGTMKMYVYLFFTAFHCFLVHIKKILNLFNMLLAYIFKCNIDITYKAPRKSHMTGTHACHLTYETRVGTSFIDILDSKFYGTGTNYLSSSIQKKNDK